MTKTLYSVLTWDTFKQAYTIQRGLQHQSINIDKGQLLEQFKPDMYAEAWWQLYKVYKELREEEMGHTKGPWIARRMDCQADSHTFNSEVVNVSGDEVASILKPDDARLIAAAPDLLEACKLAKQWMEGGMPSPYSDMVVLENLTKAITKATAQREGT